jgi:hypothetical protein
MKFRGVRPFACRAVYFHDNEVSVSLNFLDTGWRISEFLARC